MFSLYYIVEACVEPSQATKMELSAVNFFLQKAPYWMLEWVLNTPLDWPGNLFREFCKILKNNFRQNSS